MAEKTVNDFKKGDHVIDAKGEEWIVWTTENDEVYVNSVGDNEYVYFHPHELTHVEPPKKNKKQQVIDEAIEIAKTYFEYDMQIMAAKLQAAEKVVIAVGDWVKLDGNETMDESIIVCDRLSQAYKEYQETPSPVYKIPLWLKKQIAAGDKLAKVVERWTRDWPSSAKLVKAAESYRRAIKRLSKKQWPKT